MIFYQLPQFAACLSLN